MGFAVVRGAYDVYNFCGLLVIVKCTKKNGIRKAGARAESTGRLEKTGSYQKVVLDVTETSGGNPTLPCEDERTCQTESHEQMLEENQ